MLGPTLFLLFINDIDAIFSDTSVCMQLFADDVKLYSSLIAPLLTYKLCVTNL